MDAARSDVHPRQIFAQNTGKCMEENPGIGLHLGCGKHRWNGWVNIDLENADINCDLKKLDLPDDHADIAVAIHVIEHFYYWDVQAVLKEWLRVLKPGGKIVLELPCMDKVILYLVDCVNNGQLISPNLSWFAFWGDPKYGSVAMNHKWGYTAEMMIQELSTAGFRYAEIEDPRYHFAIRDMRITAIK